MIELQQLDCESSSKRCVRLWRTVENEDKRFFTERDRLLGAQESQDRDVCDDYAHSSAGP